MARSRSHLAATRYESQVDIRLCGQESPVLDTCSAYVSVVLGAGAEVARRKLLLVGPTRKLTLVVLRSLFRPSRPAGWPSPTPPPAW